MAPSLAYTISVAGWFGVISSDYNRLSLFLMHVVLQTEFMRDMMTKYGGNIICIDSTHGTNMYDFLLVSVMVIDEHGEGIPVAWAISNHEDTSTLVHFLTTVKSRVGDIKPTLFMSDDAEAFFNAWQGAFGVHKETQKLLCTFHVDRAWRKNLSEHTKDKQEMAITFGLY